MTVHAVVFDFDGVIADTERLHLCAFQRMLEGSGTTLDATIYYEQYLGCTDRELIEALNRDRGLAWSPAEVSRLVNAKADAFVRLIDADHLLLYAAARACIERLRSARPLAIASGALREEIARMLARAGLGGHFQAIVGAEEVRCGKPAPDPYLEAARQLGIAPNLCVAIEDSAWGLDSARQAGCRTIAVTHTYPRHQLTADRVVDSLDEITNDLLAGM